jgi:hypothetical protein
MAQQQPRGERRLLRKWCGHTAYQGDSQHVGPISSYSPFATFSHTPLVPTPTTPNRAIFFLPRGGASSFQTKPRHVIYPTWRSLLLPNQTAPFYFSHTWRSLLLPNQTAPFYFSHVVEPPSSKPNQTAPFNFSHTWRSLLLPNQTAPINFSHVAEPCQLTALMLATVEVPESSSGQSSFLFPPDLVQRVLYTVGIQLSYLYCKYSTVRTKLCRSLLL